MFIRTITYILNELGSIERRGGEVPQLIGCPPLRVSVPADADERDIARQLRKLRRRARGDAMTGGGQVKSLEGGRARTRVVRIGRFFFCARNLARKREMHQKTGLRRIFLLRLWKFFPSAMENRLSGDFWQNLSFQKSSHFAEKALRHAGFAHFAVEFFSPVMQNLFSSSLWCFGCPAGPDVGASQCLNRPAPW